MASLDITDGNGRIRHDVFARILGVMLHPGANDGVVRESFVARCAAECRARGMEVPFDDAMLRLVLEGEHHPLAPKGNPKPWRSGMLAGEQLAWLFSLVVGNAPNASMGRARYLVECGLSAERLPGAEKYLADAWRWHRSVAHLWAAYILRDETFHRFECLDDDTPPLSGRVDFIRFLWEAEQIRRFAVGYRPNSKVRLFEGRTEMWTLPEDMPAIAWHPGWPPLRIPIFAVTPEIQQRLSLYGCRHGPPAKRIGRPPKVL
jgi:hypothetical protein